MAADIGQEKKTKRQVMKKNGKKLLKPAGALTLPMELPKWQNVFVVVALKADAEGWRSTPPSSSFFYKGA